MKFVDLIEGLKSSWNERRVERLANSLDINEFLNLEQEDKWVKNRYPGYDKSQHNVAYTIKDIKRAVAQLNAEPYKAYTVYADDSLIILLQLRIPNNTYATPEWCANNPSSVTFHVYTRIVDTRAKFKSGIDRVISNIKKDLYGSSGRGEEEEF